MKFLTSLAVIGSIIAMFARTNGQPLDWPNDDDEYINLDDLLSDSEETAADTVEVQEDGDLDKNDPELRGLDEEEEADADDDEAQDDDQEVDEEMPDDAQMADDEELAEDAMDIRAEEDKDMEKRRWVYKCEEKECNNRCKRLLELPTGKCGYGGKCYCSRNTS